MIFCLKIGDFEPQTQQQHDKYNEIIKISGFLGNVQDFWEISNPRCRYGTQPAVCFRNNIKKKHIYKK